MNITLNDKLACQRFLRMHVAIIDAMVIHEHGFTRRLNVYISQYYWHIAIWGNVLNTLKPGVDVTFVVNIDT